MKKIFLSIFVFLAAISSQAQAPQAFSYQAVIRNSSNALVANQNVSERISLIKDSVTGTVVYSEQQNVMTNANGLVSLQIGNGSVLSGSFSGINWATGTYFVKTETDPTGGSNYTISNTTQLLSVPYALYAAEAPSLEYPDGLKNIQTAVIDSGTSYTVPVGKNFYCQGCAVLQFNYIVIDNDTINNPSNTKQIFGEKQNIKNISPQATQMQGFIIDKTLDIININLKKSSYKVPSGKSFVIISEGYYPQSNHLFLVNGKKVNSDNGSAAINYFIFSGGSIFSGDVWISGYLK